MAFDKTLLSKISWRDSNNATQWVYGPTEDDLSDVLTSGYFNDGAEYFRVGGFISVAAADGATQVQITAVDLDVTVAKFDQLTDGQVTDANINAIAGIRRNSVVIPVSFESGQQFGYKWRANGPVEISSIYAQVTDDLADTDSGTITASSPEGALADGVITFSASATAGTTDSTTPTTNNTLNTGEELTLTTAKSTAGGAANVVIAYVTLDVPVS